MTAATTCAEMIARAAAAIRKNVTDLRSDMADNDYWACDHPDATEDEIYTAGVEEALGGEAGSFAGFWTPGRALAIAVWLDAEASSLAEFEASVGISIGEPGSGHWGDALAVARTFLIDDKESDS